MPFVLKAIGGLGALIASTIPAVGAADETAPAATGQVVDRYEWVTLGTQGGPMPSKERGEPANLLMKKGNAILVDAGDGAMTKMVAAGGQFPWLKTIFISHLHVDHIGGLFAVLGLRNQTHTTVPLTIYGPPGTKALVAGIVAGLGPSTESGYGVQGEVELPADTGLQVVELNDGSVIKLADMTVRTAKNSHYSFVPGSAQDRKFASLSFRFELPDRTVVYTGDTGPSKAVEKLAKGADLLVSEMIDLKATMANVARRAPSMDEKTRQDMTTHLSTHHLTTEQIGAMAAAAGVKAVVITHIAGGGAEALGANARYVEEVRAKSAISVIVAKDLDRF